MFNILKREINLNLKSLIIWTVIITALFLVVFLVYPSIVSEGENKETLNDMLKVLPEDMLAMFNMDIAGIDSVFGWMKTEGYMILTIIGGLYSAILRSNNIKQRRE